MLFILIDSQGELHSAMITSRGRCPTRCFGLEVGDLRHRTSGARMFCDGSIVWGDGRGSAGLSTGLHDGATFFSAHGLCRATCRLRGPFCASLSSAVPIFSQISRPFFSLLRASPVAVWWILQCPLVRTQPLL